MVNWTQVYLLSEWSIRSAMLVYVPQRRSPVVARAWLLLIFICPWGGLVLYVTIGRPGLSVKRRELQ